VDAAAVRQGAVLAPLPAEAAVQLRAEAELPRRAEAAAVELPLRVEAAAVESQRRAAAELPRRAEAAAVESQRRAEAAVVELPLRVEAAAVESQRRAEAAVQLRAEAAVVELPQRVEAAVAELPRRAEAAVVKLPRRAEAAYAPRWLEACSQEALKRCRTVHCRRCYQWRYRCRWLFRHAAAHREAHDCPAESPCCRCRSSCRRRRYPRCPVTAR
jgi:hypothetical protein